VIRAVEAWARRIVQQRPEAVRIGYFGSYARGDASVGSDLDLLIVVRDAPERIEHRTIGWETTTLPVPVDLLVYTEQEMEHLRSSPRFRRVLEREIVWIHP